MTGERLVRRDTVLPLAWMLLTGMALLGAVVLMTVFLVTRDQGLIPWAGGLFAFVVVSFPILKVVLT